MTVATLALAHAAADAAVRGVLDMDPDGIDPYGMGPDGGGPGGSSEQQWEEEEEHKEAGGVGEARVVGVVEPTGGLAASTNNSTNTTLAA